MIVGVGGSAGSLTPLRELFGALPAKPGLAFVVVSHQASSGQSLLPAILAKNTAMPVRELEGNTPVESNHVYVVPRGHSVAVKDAVLAIEPIGEPSRVPLPIDHFFRALAQDRGHCSVGIVLSGTGSDGTLGLAAIHGESGLCLVQDPKTAEFDGMPESAIAAQALDFVLPIREMPARLLEYARAVRATGRECGTSGVSSAEMERILSLIRVRGNHDFTAYKRDTLLRRVERRMDLHRIERLADYASYLEGHDDEIDALWRDWLIGVSAFFRDPEAFQALAESGLPRLIMARADDRRLRVWVPGCATGEEAYSIAMLVLETLEKHGEHLEVQIFATDLDPTAIEAARAGRYPKTIAGAVGARRLEQFFVEEEHTYRAKKKLRDSDRIRRPGRPPRSAVHAGRSDLLSQPADLSGSQGAAGSAVHLSLQPEPGRPAAARRERACRRLDGALLDARQTLEALPARRLRRGSATLPLDAASSARAPPGGPAHGCQRNQVRSDGDAAHLSRRALRTAGGRRRSPGPDPTDPRTRRALSRARPGPRQPERRGHGARRLAGAAGVGAP